MLTHTLAILFFQFIPVFLQDVLTCGVSHGCFLSPSGCKDGDCTFIYKWADNGDSTNFLIAGKVSSFTNKYLAMGFSKDAKMGSDSVVVCKASGEVYSYYNPDDSPYLIDSANPALGISAVNVKQTGSWLICEFTRKKQYASVSARKRRSAANEYYDLTNKFNVLAAFGSINGNTLREHSKKAASADRVDFTSLDTTYEAENYAKAKAHGALMVIAWFLFASTGIVMARYCKNVFPGKTYCGVQFWFTIHRPFMLMVPILSTIALLVILAQLDWKWIETSDKAEFAHSIFGIVAIGFSVFQPFIALLRCDKDDSRRWIFNWIHRIIGLLALLFAIVAIFIGVNIDDMKLGSTGWGLVLGWTLWLILLVVALELVVLRFDDKYAISDSESAKISSSVKSGFLIAHLIVTLAFTIALVVMIGKGDVES